MKRRDFVLVVSGGLAAAAVPTALYYFGDLTHAPFFAQPTALSQIWEIQTINEIGGKYRLLMPEEEERSTLVKLLSAEMENDQIVLELDKNVEQDFSTGRTVLVDSWILSVTEARQCALASTQQP